MSIFSKICPQCAGDNPVDVSRCQCGFVFDASATTGSYRALEMAEQEALVYAEYLQARMNQEKETAEIAISDQVRFPDDSAKSATAKTANEDYLAAKAEYDEQMKLVLELRRETKRAHVIEQKERENVWEKAKQRAKQKTIKTEQKALAAKQKTKKDAAIKQKKQQQAKMAAKKKAEAKHLARHKAEIATKAAAKKLAIRQAGQKTPSPKMRKKMAKDAESAATRVRRTQASTQKEMAAATLDNPDTRIQAETKPAKNPNEKDCPNCTAIVPVSAKKCKCGYGFPQGTEQMDGVGLSEEESANLLNMFQPGSGA